VLNDVSKKRIPNSRSILNDLSFWRYTVLYSALCICFVLQVWNCQCRHNTSLSLQVNIMLKSTVSTLLRRRGGGVKSSPSFATTSQRSLATSSNDDLVKTSLYSLHKELGGDMVPFAGYELPVLYKSDNGGVMKEHLWCRSDNKASLFDVSHMGQESTALCFILLLFVFNMKSWSFSCLICFMYLHLINFTSRMH